MYSLRQIANRLAEQGCLNGHDPEFIETRENGTKNCRKCRDGYHAKSRIQGHYVTPPIKENDNAEQTRSR